MKAYTALDLINMDKKSLSFIQSQLNKALNISKRDQEFLSDVKKIAMAQNAAQDLRRIVGLQFDNADINEIIEDLYNETIKIIDQAIIRLTPNEMTTWKSLNNVIEGNLRHN